MSCKVCCFNVLKCLFITKEMIVVSFTTVLGISVITTSLVMLFSYIPIMIHDTDSKVLDLPPKTR